MLGEMLQRLILMGLSSWVAWEARQHLLSEVLGGQSLYAGYAALIFAGMLLYTVLSWLFGGLGSHSIPRLRALPRELGIQVLTFGLLGLGAFFLQQHLVSRTWLMVWFLMNLCFSLFRDSLIRLGGRRPFRRILIVGESEFRDWLAEWIRRHIPHVHIVHAGVYANVERAIASREPDEILIASTLDEDWERILASAFKAGMKPTIRDLSWLSKTLRGPSQLDRYADFLCRMLDEPSDQDTYLRLKRLFDVSLSCLSFPVWGPLVAFCALILRLSQSGSVFYHHYRVGEMGTLFSCHKFRTMKESDTFGKPHGREDARMERLGWFLRRSSLDELPQMLNVLKGEMSLVGPRPELPRIVGEDYGPLELKRMLMKPGITGLWQIHGRKQPIHAHLKYDFYYLRNQSMLLDLWILLRTIPAVILKRGAR